MRNHREDQVILGEPAVVDHAGIRAFEPQLACFLAVLVEREERDIRRRLAFRGIGIADQLLRHRIDLRVRGKGLGRHLPVPIPQLLGLERLRVERIRRAVLFEREQHAVVQHDVGIRHGADDALHARVVGKRIAVFAKQAAPRRALGHEAVRAHILVLHVDVAVLDPERRHHAVAVERVGVAEHRRKLLIGADAIERAVERRGNFAFDLQIEQLALEAERLVDRQECRRFRKRLGHS